MANPSLSSLSCRRRTRPCHKIAITIGFLLLINLFISLLEYHSIQRKLVIEILKEMNEVLQWTTIQPIVVPSFKNNINSTTLSFNNTIPISLIILQGRDHFQPTPDNALYTTPALFQPIFYRPPKPLKSSMSRRPWHCHLLQIYNDMLDDLFHKQQLPYVVVAEDDIIVLADHVEPLFHQIQGVIHQNPRFYSFYTSGNNNQKNRRKHNKASYRHGTPFFYMRSSFYEQLQPVCFQTCVTPIDICMAENFLLGQSTNDYIYHPHGNRFIPKELQVGREHRRLLLFWS